MGNRERLRFARDSKRAADWRACPTRAVKSMVALRFRGSRRTSGFQLTEHSAELRNVLRRPSPRRAMGRRAGRVLRPRRSSGRSGSAAQPKFSLAPSSGGICLSWCDGHDRPACGEDAVHFARYDHAFKSPLDRNDVRVGCGEHGRDFARREEGKKSNVRVAGCKLLQARALCPVAYKNKTYAVVF